MENCYYVYIHRRKDNNEVFYVGKGKGKRAYSTSGRNKYWRNVYNKAGRTVEIVEKELSEASAFLLEIELIKFYRECNTTLTNITDGGEGCSGVFPNEETRAKLSFAAFTRIRPRHTQETKEKMSKTRKGQIKEPRTEAAKEAISKALKGKVLPHMVANRKAVLCSNGMVFESIQFAVEWLVSQGVPSVYHANVSKCCHGKIRSAYGYVWSFVE
jgi:hypothetical protein